MKRILAAGACLALAQLLGGCSTVRGDFHQNLQIDALDANGHPVDGMHCQIGSGSSAKTFVTPATNVRVHRAVTTLNIDCRLDSLVATATVRPRRERMEEALLPFGSVGVFVDHLSGSLYAYPSTLHLRVGQHVVLEHGGEAQIVKSEPVQADPQAGPATPQRTALAAAQPAAATTTASNPSAAPAAQKSAATKANRAVSKPVKPASVATNATTTKPKAAPSKAAVAATAAAAGTVTAVHSAPVNW